METEAPQRKSKWPPVVLHRETDKKSENRKAADLGTVEDGCVTKALILIRRAAALKTNLCSPMLSP